MKPRLLFSAAVASSIAVLAACGGAKDNELFASPSSEPALASTTSPTDPTPGTGTEPSSTSSGGSSTSSTSSTSSGGSTSSTSSSGGSTSSSGGSTSSSGGTSTPAGIWCGHDEDGDDVYCKSGTACCGKNNGGTPSLECVSGGLACQGGLAIKCDDQTDCSLGQVCCGMFDENFGYKSVSCSPSCINAGTIKAVRFCDQNATTDECAASGKTCQWSGSLPGYSVCK